MEPRLASLLDDLLHGCLSAVDEEILAVREDLRRRGIEGPVPASGGARVETGAAGPLYAWSLPPGRYAIRPEDAVRVETERGGGLGFVSGFDPRGRSVRVRLGEWLGPHPGPALLTFDPTWLLEALAARLREVEDDPSRFHPRTALRLFGREYPDPGETEPPRDAADGLDPAQRRALGRVLGSATQFVWGPPGTGKTRLLGHAVASLAEEGRVLVVATTNVAVDEAAARVAARLGERAVTENRLVRAGAADSPSGDPRLSLEAAVERAERRQPGRMTRALLELEGTLLDGAARGATIGLTLAERHARLLGLARRQGDDDLLARAARLTGDRARAERRALDGADVVVTTFARLAAREELAEQRFRSVVIDEAGAAPLPYVLFASCLASDRAAAFGDFQQLPPVVMSRGPAARRWLSRDLFRQADVVAADGGGLPSDGDRLCALLDRQYRMRPPIRALVSDLFYGGRLSDAPEVEERPGVPGGIVLVDTGSLVPAVERTDGSRENAAHLEVLLQALELLARSGLDDVAVVTPYRAQSRRLARLARDRLGRAAPQGLEISTIHRFQGREKSVVILDTVDAPPDRSWFLDERRNPEFPRLLNVALSRSRDLLLVVATPEGLARTLPPEALLNRVVARIAADGIVVDGGRMHELLHLVRGPGG
jgi:hypothetical protein